MNTSSEEVLLEIPSTLSYQLVYRLERREPVSCEFTAKEKFVWLDGVGAIVKKRRMLWRNWRLFELIKNCLKVMSGHRVFYGVVSGDHLVHAGWVTLSRCRYYWVEPGAAVIGPVWTADEWRGRGLAYRALQSVMNMLVKGGMTCFYIDTSGQNIPMQKVIKKCGFGLPVGAFIKGHNEKM